MARARSPNRDKAFELWRDSGGQMLLKEIAEELNVSDSLVRKWKKADSWEVQLNGHVPNGNGHVTNESNGHVTKRGGAPKGNKNARGNKGGHGAPKGNQYAVGNNGGAPPRNSNAVSHGFFRKYFPEETLEIMEQIETRSPLDMLWDNIVIQYTAIIRAQQIMFVQSKDEMIKELKKRKFDVVDTSTKDENSFEQVVTEEEYEFQFSWDRQATFLNAQSRAMVTMQSLIRQYEDLCNKGLATEEQLLRIEKLKGEVDLLKQKATADTDKPIEILIKRKGETT